MPRGLPSLLPMPRLRDVLDPRLALIADQNERESVSIRSAKLVHAGTVAVFGDAPCLAGFLHCHCIACQRVGAPDFRLWLGSHRVKCAVGIDCPDGAEGVGPLTGECRRAGRRHRLARTDQRDEYACENNSERML
jgi:hypothetical protein